MIWLPVPSLMVGLFIGLGAAVLLVMPRRVMKGRQAQELPVSPRRMALVLLQFGWVLLCSGSYTLADIKAPTEGVAVRVRFI